MIFHRVDGHILLLRPSIHKCVSCFCHVAVVPMGMALPARTVFCMSVTPARNDFCDTVQEAAYPVVCVLNITEKGGQYVLQHGH